MTWTVRLPIQALSENDIVSRCGDSSGTARRKWRLYTRVRDQCIIALRAWRHHDSIPHAEVQREACVVRLYGKGQRDYDYGNLSGGMKPVLDAMEATGLIVDDSPRWLRDTYDQHRDRERPGIEITLRDVDAEERRSRGPRIELDKGLLTIEIGESRLPDLADALRRLYPEYR